MKWKMPSGRVPKVPGKGLKAVSLVLGLAKVFVDRRIEKADPPKRL